jgi:hypothetical protein
MRTTVNPGFNCIQMASFKVSKGLLVGTRLTEGLDNLAIITHIMLAAWNLTVSKFHLIRYRLEGQSWSKDRTKSLCKRA